MDIRPLTGNLGAEIYGADVANPDHFEGIRQAFIDHSVITVRDQSIGPDDHIAFAQRWGTINVNRFFKPLETHPEIALVVKEASEQTAVGEDWHTDQSYDTEPTMCSILHAIELPPYGGDTCFSSMYVAYDTLSESFKELLDGLYAWHSSRHAFGETQVSHEQYVTGRLQNADKATQDALHPIIITHPLSGRKAIYVNPDFTTHINGLAAKESKAILEFLYDHCKNAEFQCRVTWRPGDITMWDNLATWHKATNDYQGHRRYMHRVTIEGGPVLP